VQIFRRQLGKSTLLHGAGVINALLEIISNTKPTSTIYICGNSKFPSKIFSYDSVNKLINTSRQRGIKQRCIFEITKENVLYCKNLMKMRNGSNDNSAPIIQKPIANEELIKQIDKIIASTTK
jgi:hypothetical protein